MMQQMLLGLGGRPVPLLISEVFKNQLYTGNNSTNTINNGINIGDSSESLNGKTITDTTGGGADYSKLNNNIISSNNTDYYYNAAGNIDCYIDYGSAVVSGFYNLYPQGDASQSPPIVYNTPQSVTGYGSNNASSWTSLGTATFDTSDWSNGKPTKAVFTNETAYRYYRLEVAGNGKTLQEWHLGIGQAGKGGLVWVKNRVDTGGSDFLLFDTERGVATEISSSQTRENRDTGSSNGLQSFNSNGFTLKGNWVGENASGDSCLSWTFRKAPKFFDIVTFSGNGTDNRSISHNLGSVPGMIFVKQITGGVRDWVAVHRSMTSGKIMFLNKTNGPANASGTLGLGDANNFTVGYNTGYLNISGCTYVAYLFAHDEASFGTDGDESIIKCGTYTGDGSSNRTINTGFKPQWVMIKRNGEGAWYQWDNLRSFNYLRLNTNTQEFNGYNLFRNFASNGFIVNGNGSTNTNGNEYLYMAISE